MNNQFEHLGIVGSGTYLPEDVTVLLRAVEMAPTNVEEKEHLIQTQQRHYSEMIGHEHAPTHTHMDLYKRALEANAARMAQDVQSLAQALDALYKGPTIAVVSFVRAGLPLGVLLRRALNERGREVQHYGISIIRDRGIDPIALEAIIEAHGAKNIAFVDGWTGKGAISTELRRSLAGDTRFPADPPLVVLADPCGKAWLSASADDWIIPSGILGATVSGLVSRSIWPQAETLHGCVVYDHLRAHDVTQAFIQVIEDERARLTDVPEVAPWTDDESRALQQQALAVIDQLAQRFDITHLNRIKPGIAEATRAVLRRVPDRVLVRRHDDPDVQLLMYLTQRAGIAVEEAGDALGPYRAVTLIRGIH